MKRLLVILILIILFGFSEETLRTAEGKPVQPPSTTVSYLPLISSRPCPENNTKANIALAYWERGIAHDLLCIPDDNLYHNWGWTAGKDANGNKVPMVWDEKALILWERFRLQWEAENEREYDWFLLVVNEADRPDQADMTPEEVAQLILDIIATCPRCRLIGPMYSAADAGWLVAEVWRQVEEVCGSPCPIIENNLYAHSLHIYPRPDDNHGPAWRAREFCKIVEGEEDCEKPIWITEMGYRTCFPAVYKVFKSWVIEAVNHPGIEQVFVYSGFQAPQANCHFFGMLSWDTWEIFGINELRPMGRAWRDGLIEAGYSSFIAD